MQITLFEAAGGTSFTGEPELHLRVLTDELMDLPRVVGNLTPEQAIVWGRYTSSPHYFYPADAAEDRRGFKYDDEWHFFKKGDA